MTVRHDKGRFAASEAGTAAAEFAILFPLLVLMLLGSVDLARTIQERLALGGVLRAGAEAAMRQYPKSEIELAMLAASNLRIGVSNAPFGLTTQADQICSCPATPTTFFACVDPTSPSYPCGLAEPALVFWRMTAQKTVTTLFLPSTRFEKKLLVQIR